MNGAELTAIGDLAELGLQLARMKGELEAVKSERDFLRSILADQFRPQVVEMTEPLFTNQFGIW